MYTDSRRRVKIPKKQMKSFYHKMEPMESTDATHETKPLFRIGAPLVLIYLCLRALC